MINALLVVLLVTSEGYQVAGVQAFKTMAECKLEMAKVLVLAHDKMPQGTRYALECTAVKTAGPSV